MSYKGRVVELPLGQGGMIGPNISGNAPPDTLLQARNVSFVDGQIRKERGAIKGNPTPLFPGLPYVSVEAGHDWWPTPTQQYAVIVVSDGANSVLMRDNSDGIFFQITGITLTGQLLPPMFVDGGIETPNREKKLFVFTPRVTTVVLKGTDLFTTTIGGTPIAPPAACSAIDTGLVGAGNVNQGTYQYVVTFITPDGETTPSNPSNPVYQPQSGGGVIKLQSIATPPTGVTGDGTVVPTSITARKVYRSQIGGGGPYKLLTTISDITTDEYYDVTAQASLGAGEPPAVNNTNGRPTEWSGTNWPGCGALHANRLWAAGNLNDPHRAYYSTTADHENFLSQNAGSLQIYPGEGQYISGMISFSGIMIVWKYPRGIYTIDTRSVDNKEWKVERLTTSFGGINGQTQAMIEGDVVFMDSTGDIQLLSAVQEFTNLGSQSLSKALQIDDLIIQYADSFGLFYSKMVYYPRRRELHIAMRLKGQSVNGIRLVLDGNRPDRPRFRVSDRDVCQSLWIRRQLSGSTQQMQLISGDDHGQVWIMDQDGNAKNGAGYDSRYQTMWTDLSFADPLLATQDKHAQFLEMAFNPTGRWPVNVTVWWDARVANQATFISADPFGYYLGTWALGSGALVDGTAVLIRRFRLTGGGRRVSLEISNDQPGQDFSIAHAYLSFTAGGERTR